MLGGVGGEERDVALPDLHRAAFQALATGVVVVSADGWILDANDAHLAQVGRTREELVGHYAPVYAHPDDVEVLFPLVAALLAGERDEVRHRCRFVDGEGRTRGGRLIVRRAELAGRGPLLVVAHDPDEEPAEVPGDDLPFEGAALHLYSGAATYAVHGADGRVTRASRGLAQILGRSADDLAGRRWTDAELDAVLPDGRRLTGTDDPVGRAAAAGHATLDTVGVRRPDGTRAWVSMAATLAPFGGGRVVITSVTDVSEVVRAHEDRGRLASIVELTADVVASFRADGTCRWLNAAAARALGVAAADEVHLDDVLDPRSRARLEEVVVPAVARDGIWTGEVDLEVDGRRLPLAANVIGDRAGGGHLVGWTLVGHDLTDHKALQAELAHLATHDELTGIPNRMLLAERLDRVDASGEPLTVAFVDLDGFKAVNDTHGHHLGDLVLIEVSRRLAATIGPHGFVARYGGDEFVVLADPTWEDVEGPLARPLSEPVVVGGLHLHLHGSIGVARRRPGEPARDVLARADQVMYRGKAARRNPLHEALVRPPAGDQVSS